MGKREVSGRLFDNVLLERLSHVHPVTPLLVWTPVIAWLLWRSFTVHGLGAGAVTGLGAAGLLAWTLTEYLVHRFVFHGSPTSPGRRHLQFVLHGIHHAYPNDPTRLVMPPAVAILGHTALYWVFRSLLGQVWVEPFFALFLMGYLAYDYIHLALHQGRPRTRLGRYLRRWHMLHHFENTRARWGVSSPLWDHVFSTVDGRGGAGSLPASR
jgi:sterol desaturase/sphingolipid hydroxylase (fatty acid hydroxylase superfamily)